MPFANLCLTYRVCTLLLFVYVSCCPRRYVHWENDPGDDQMQAMATGAGGLAVPKYLQALQEPQWINCDVRNFDWSILGKFGVIMTDPPWHIRQVCVCRESASNQCARRRPFLNGMQSSFLDGDCNLVDSQKAAP
jgi:hypothetical protein